MSKLDGIRDEVVYNLEYAISFCSDNALWQTFFHAERDIGIYHFKQGRLGDFFNEAIYIYFRVHELQRPSLNFREVENVID